MLKITDIIIANTFSPYKGGVARYLTGISDELSKFVQLTVITRIDSNYPENNAYDISRSILYNKNPFLNKFYHYLLCTVHLFSNIFTLKRIYAGAAVPYGLIALMFKLIKPSLNTYIFTYGSELLCEKNRIHVRLRDFVLRKADHIITISNYSNNVLENITDKPIIIAPPGYDGQFAVNNNNDSECIRLLTVASLNRRKGQHLVIEALKNLKDKMEFSYTIIGNGPEKTRLNHMIQEYGLEDRITVKCGLSDEEVRKHYSQSDIFIMTTFKDNYDIEGFGIVYLEAGAFQLPIIASPVGGVVDIVEDGVNGIMVKEQCIDDIENAIKTLAGDSSLRNKMGKAAALTARKFTYERAVNNIMKSF